MSSARSRRYEKSGSTRSIPCISAVGNISPVSTTTIRPSYSITVMFLPISPRPPKGSTRNLLGTRSSYSLSLSLVLTGDRDAGSVEAGLDGGPLLLVGGHQGKSQSVLAETQHRQGRLQRDRVGRDGGGFVDRRDLRVDLSRALNFAGLGRLPHLAHLVT